MNLMLRSPDSADPVQITADVSRDELFELMRDTWIMWWECAKCGRSDYCAFKRAETQCGVAVSVLKNWLEFTFDTFSSGDHQARQSYLDASYHLVTFIHDTEIDIGHLLARDHVQAWEDGGGGMSAKTLFACILRSRQHLDGFAHKLGALKAFRSTEAVLFVEGASEKALLESLFDSGLWHFTHLQIIDYSGRANRHPRRIQLLHEDLTRRGYTMFIQGDADGLGADTFVQLKARLGLPPQQTFAFEHDLEHSIPLDILNKALARLGEEPVTRRPSATSGDDADPVVTATKMALAESVGYVLREGGVRLYHEPAFRNSELFEFLAFAQRAAHFHVAHVPGNDAP